MPQQIIITIANCIGSIPKTLIKGKNRGKVTYIIAIPSRKVPKTINTKLIITRKNSFCIDSIGRLDKNISAKPIYVKANPKTCAAATTSITAPFKIAASKKIS